jgi:hypothetical protein
MMRTLAKFSCAVIVVVLSLVFADTANAIKVLMHGRDPGATFRDDSFVYSHLQNRYGAANVTYMQGSTAASDGSSANGFDVIFISSTMASSATRDKYEDSTKGIVLGENALVTDDSVGNFMLSDGGGNQDATAATLGKTKINILNSGHPLAAGLSGEVTVFNTTPTDTYWWQFARGALAPGVNRIATSQLDIGTASVSADYNANSEVDAGDYVYWRKGGTPLTNEVATSGANTPEDYTEWQRRFGNLSSLSPPDEQHAILAADIGARLWGNGETGRPATAAGRRVFMFLSDFGFFDLTADGVKLFDAAIDWAATTGPGSGSVVGAVPEPGCCALVFVALLGGMAMRRRSAR